MFYRFYRVLVSFVLCLSLASVSFASGSAASTAASRMKSGSSSFNQAKNSRVNTSEFHKAKNPPRSNKVEDAKRGVVHVH